MANKPRNTTQSARPGQQKARPVFKHAAKPKPPSKANAQPPRSNVVSEHADFRIAPILRTPRIIEHITDVPRATYERLRELRERAASVELVGFFSHKLGVAVDERFNEIRADKNNRKVHDFSTDWFGGPTPQTLALLRKWKAIKSGELIAGMTVDVRKCRLLLEAQNIELPKSVTLAEIRGIEWNYQLFLSIPQLRAPRGSKKTASLAKRTSLRGTRKK
jgi:hypothetical protein